MSELIQPFNYADSIKGLMKASSMTQSDLAGELGLTQGRISQYLNSPNEEMRYEPRFMLHKLCVEYGIEMKPKAQEK